METWGELFWDAWIRLRLACRRVMRAYWPPRFQAWQICTVTGIASIILTFAVLNLTSDKSLLHAKNPTTKAPAKTSTKTVGKATGKGLAKAAPSKSVAEPADPFESIGVTDPDTELALDSVDGPPPQQQFVPTRKRGHGAEVAQADLPPLERDLTVPEATDPGESDMPLPEMPEPIVDEFVAAPPESGTGRRSPLRTALPAESEFQDETPALTGPVVSAEPETTLASEGTDETSLEAPGQTPVEAPQGTADEATGPAFDAVPVVPTPAVRHEVVREQDPNLVGRFGSHEDTEEARHSVRELRAAPPPALPPAVQHTPFETPIRSNNNFSRLGALEDAEEGRHSVRNIRPTRTDNVAFPGAKVGEIAVVQVPPVTPATPTAPVEPTPELTVPEVTAPDASEVAPAEPVTESRAEPQFDASGFESGLTPAVPATPHEGEAESGLAEPPPVLFAPEPEPVAAEPAKSPTYHGPVRSTEPVDHEAHVEEDGFKLPPRRPLSDWPELEDTLPNNVVAKPADETPVTPAVPEVTPPVDTPAIHRETGKRTGRSWADDDHHADDRRGDDVKISSEPYVPTEAPEEPEHTAEPMIAEPEVEAPMVEQPQDVVPESMPEEVEPMQPAQPDEFDVEPVRPAPVGRFEDDDAEMPPKAEDPVEPAEPVPSEPRVIDHEEYDAREDAEPKQPSVPEPMQERVTIPDGMPPVGPMPRTAPERQPTWEESSEFTAVRKVEPPRPIITMEISGPNKVPAGAQAILHFKLHNTGTVPVTGIVVSDVLPPGLKHRLSSDLEYVIPRLEPGATRETNLTVQCVTPGQVVNRATLKADGDISVQAEILIEVTTATERRGNAPPPPESPLVMRHHGPERWLIDSTGQFLITVTNPSQQTIRNVTITQTLPEGTNLVHATVGNKVDTKQRTVTWTITEFAPGVSYILETELHSLTSGATTSVAKVQVGGVEVSQDRWTAVSHETLAARPR